MRYINLGVPTTELNDRTARLKNDVFGDGVDYYRKANMQKNKSSMSVFSETTEQQWDVLISNQAHSYEKYLENHRIAVVCY